MNLQSIKIWLAKNSRLINAIILFLFFVVIAAVLLYGSTMIVDQKGSITGQELKRIGFVLKVNNKTEWKTDIMVLAKQVNAEVNNILVITTKNDRKNAKRDLKELSFEIVENEKDFKKKMDKIFVITYATTADSTIHLTQEKVIFGLKNDEQYLKTLKIYLRTELGLSRYDEFLK